MLTSPHTGQALEKPCHQAGLLPTLKSAFFIRQGVPSHIGPECPPTSGRRALGRGCSSWSDGEPHSGHRGCSTSRFSFWAVALFFPRQVESTPRNRNRVEHGYTYLQSRHSEGRKVVSSRLSYISKKESIKRVTTLGSGDTRL